MQSYGMMKITVELDQLRILVEGKRARSLETLGEEAGALIQKQLDVLVDMGTERRDKLVLLEERLAGADRTVANKADETQPLRAKAAELEREAKGLIVKLGKSESQVDLLASQVNELSAKLSQADAPKPAPKAPKKSTAPKGSK